MKVAYICDQKGGCKSKWPSCKNPEFADLCTHTTDPEHAVNGKCANPDKDPDRFEEIRPGVFWEILCKS